MFAQAPYINQEWYNGSALGVATNSVLPPTTLTQKSCIALGGHGAESIISEQTHEAAKRCEFGRSDLQCEQAKKF